MADDEDMLEGGNQNVTMPININGFKEIRFREATTHTKIIIPFRATKR